MHTLNEMVPSRVNEQAGLSICHEFCSNMVIVCRNMTSSIISLPQQWEFFRPQKKKNIFSRMGEKNEITVEREICVDC